MKIGTVEVELKPKDIEGIKNKIKEDLINEGFAEVIRCKDCKYSQFKDNGVLCPTAYCHRLNVIISGKGKGYCYLAERKDGESK